MIKGFLVVLMTTNIGNQLKFYKDILGLDIISEHADTIGLGKNGSLYLVLRDDHEHDSHHLTEHKGPQIITFKCEGDLNISMEKIRSAGFKIRDNLRLPEYNSHYLFVEDADHNEVCLDFIC
jgi:catechol-2,3-dioxygenase